MTKSIFNALIISASIFLFLAIYYLIPGINHPFVSSDPTASHLKHFVGLLGISVILFGLALANRSKIGK